MVKQRLGLQPLEKWIDGFQYIGKRPLADEERRFLTGHLSDAANPSNMVMVGLFAAAVVSLLAASGTGAIGKSLFGPLLALSIVVTAIIPLMWLEQVKDYHEDLADIALGEVEIYQAGPEDLFPVRMVYLPRSTRVLSQQGRFLTRRRYLRVNHVAPLRNTRSACFPQQFTLEQGRLSMVRPLTGLERSELEAFLPEPHRWVWLLPSVLWAWCLIGVVDLFEHGNSVTTLLRIVLVALGAISLSAYYWIRSRRYARVKQDLIRGTVVSEKWEGYVFEHLASSALVWTVDSVPAPWRKRSWVSRFCPMI